MKPLWKLVLIAVISTGLSNGSDPESLIDLNNEESRHTTFLTRSDILSAVKFQCNNKPSGYYADPRFDCKVFHFCHEDGTRVTIPCSLESEKHSICIFRDITFNACEGSEIYLALPEDLHVKPPKDTTASAINSATEYKLSNVLPLPNYPSDNNHSTTPLSLELEQTAKSNSLTDSKEVESIFEVFNTVLREIQADKNGGKVLPDNSNFLKLSPSTFSRGSQFQASPIRRDDSDEKLQNENRKSDEQDTYLVEVNQKGNEKLLDNHNSNKKSKRLFFLPKLEKKVPGTYPRRKKRMVVAEPLNVSRPYAIIYAKVPDATSVNVPKTGRKPASQRQDIIEVPFVAARVPADVPTVPITIETRRKKKKQSKKKTRNIPLNVYLEEAALEEAGNEQTSEQRNVIFFAPEQAPGIGLDDVHGRSVIDDRYRSRQNTEQAQRSPQQNSLQSEAISPQNANPLQLPNFPFQPNFMSNSAPQQFYFGSQDLQQPGNFQTFGLPDQFVLQSQPPPDSHSHSFRRPDVIQTQSIRQQENNQPQVVRQLENNSQNTRQRENNPLIFRQHESGWPQNIRQTENIPSQSGRQSENIQHQPSRQTENRTPQDIRIPENGPPQSVRQPENSLQSFRQPASTRPQIYSQPEIAHPQTFRQPENIQTQILRQPENLQPQTVRQPELIQPQTIRQLGDVQFRNIPGLPFREPQGVHQTIRLPQSNEPQLLQNGDPQNVHSNDQDNRIRHNRGRQQRLPESTVNQRFPGFDSPFFQNFQNLGSLQFNGPYTQPGPNTYELLPPLSAQFQEQFNPPQHSPIQERPREQVPQELKKPQDHLNPQFARAQNSNQQQYPHNVRQQPPVSQPEASVVYLPQSNQNPNLIQAERAKQERRKPARGNAGPQIVIAIPQSARPSRNRGRPSTGTESSTPQPDRQRNRDQSQRQTLRSPQENRVRERPRQEPQQHPNQSPRRPPEQQHPLTEVVYRPQRPHEVSHGEIQNANRHHVPYPSTAIVPDFRSQVSPQSQNTRDNHREEVLSQRQPTGQRNRHYYNENGNEQSFPQYSTPRYVPTTPLPSSPPRQRNRRPEQYPPPETYHQNSRPMNEKSATTSEDDRPFYGYRSTPAPYEKPRTSDSPYESSRTYISPYVRTRTSPSPYEIPRTSASPYERPRTSASPYERPRASASPYEKPRTSASPYERPDTSDPRYQRPRESAPSYENQRTRTSPAQHESQGLPVTSRYFVTSSPRFRPSEIEKIRSQNQEDLRSESHNERPRSRPQAQIERPPPEYVSAEPYPEEYPRPQRYQSYRPQHNPNVGNDVEVISTVEDSDHRPRTSSGNTRPGYRDTSSERKKPIPEVEHGFLPVSERPPRQYSHASRAPYREPDPSYREPENERVHSNRYQNYNEEIPTTRLKTTPKPTKKPKPPPPRPTFPSFPTFPPPPRRLTTTPRPVTTEDPEQRKEVPQTIAYATEDPTTTRETIQRSRSKIEVRTEISELKDVVTESYLQTEVPEVTTKRRTRKRKPKQRRPKTTTSYPDDEDVIQGNTITQATTRKEIVTRSTPSNYNRWRQQTVAQRKTTASSDSPSTEAPANDSPSQTEEYGSRINLFGRPRTRKPAVYSPRTATTTPTPSISQERKRASRTPTVTRTRKPFTKKLRKKTTTETPETTDPIARSDENEDALYYNSDGNYLQGLESVTQLSVKNLDDSFQTEPYNDVVETTEATEETTTLVGQDEPSNSNDKMEDFESTRSVSKKFQVRPRILKFGKPRLRTTDSPLDLNAAESKILR